MLFFSNENGKIFLYLFNIININSSPFQEPSNSCTVEKEIVIDEPESVNTNSQIKPNISIQVKHFTPINETESSVSVSLDSIPQNKEIIMCDEDQQYPLSLSSNTQEDCLKYTSNELYKLEDISSSEQSEEIDVETIDTNDGNGHIDVIEPEPENNQIVNPTHRDQKLQKYFDGGIFKPYMSEKSDVSCSKSNHYDYDTTRFNAVNLFSGANFTDYTLLDHFKINYGIHKNVVLSRPFKYEEYFSPDITTPKYLLNQLLLRKNINPNNITFKNTRHFTPEMETISDTKIHHIHTNKTLVILNSTIQIKIMIQIFQVIF